MSFIDLHTNVSLGHTKIVGLGGEKLWLCPTLGGDKLDISGNGNHGTYNGGMSTVADTSNGGTKAYSFDGVNDEIPTGTLSSYSFIQNTAEFSVSAWVKPYAVNRINPIIISTTGTAEKGFYFRIETSNVFTCAARLGVSGQSVFGVSTTATASVNQWVHVCCTGDGQDIYFYINGSLATVTGNPSATVGTLSTGDSTRIASVGRNPVVSNQWFYGLQDDIRIFDRALTTTEIKHLASKRGVLGTPRNPVIKKRRIFYAPTAPVTTTAKAVVLKKPKPSYATGYARNASESANPNLWKGLVGAWMPSLGVTGFTVKDASGNGKHITMDFNGVNGMTPNFAWRAGKKGRHISHDGINDRLLGEDYEDFSFGDGTTDRPFSIELLVKFDGFKFFTGVVSKDEGGATREWTLGVSTISSSRYFRLFIKNQGGNNQQSVDAIDHQLETNKWYHVVTTYDGRGGNTAYQGMKIYVDAAPSSLGNVIANSYTAMSNTSARFQIGNYGTLNIGGSNSFTFAGDIASTKIYNRALSPSEIKQLYLNPAAPFLRKQQTVGISTAQAFNPYWANQATQLAGTLQ